MITKIVNKFLLEDILHELIGGADMDEFNYLTSHDRDNEQETKKIITDFILPYYEFKSLKYKEIFKDSLAYFIKSEKLDFGRIMYSNLLPFESPSKPINFFIWIWEVLYPNENYLDFSEYKYIEKNDIHILNRLQKN